MNQPPEDKKIEYTLLMEDGVKAGHLLIYWGYSVFHCNFNDPKYPNNNFVVLYARGVTDDFFQYGTPGYFIGTAARDIQRGEPIIWDPLDNTADVIVKGRGFHMLMKDPGLPPSVIVTQNESDPVRVEEPQQNGKDTESDHE